jgi:curved DNA-binding protein CbpA
MAPRSLYEIMMLHPTATHEVISAVYRVLAKQFHPDHAGPDSARQMAQLNDAYAILGDEAKRASYDEIQAPDGTPRVATAPAAAPPKPSTSASPERHSMPGATNLKYEAGNWSVRPPEEPTPAPPIYGEAGQPPSHLAANGSVVSFGRYRGWAISQVAAYDRNYVEWLSRTMAGRSYRVELEQAMGQAVQKPMASRLGGR